jgi:hypothetical protein
MSEQRTELSMNHALLDWRLLMVLRGSAQVQGPRDRVLRS